MTFRRLVAVLAIIVGITWSQQISHGVRKVRHKRDGAPSIVYGNVDTQVRNNFVISRNVSLPPGSQVVAGSVLTQERNQFLTIAETGKLVVMMPDMIQLPEPLSIMGLNDSQIDNLLAITPEQRNAQVIYNLKQSLNIFRDICERMEQSVDHHFIANPVNSGEDSNSYYSRDYYERLWHGSLTLHRMKLNRLERTLDRLIRKIRVGDGITDSEVSRARQDALVVLTSHKKAALTLQEVLGSS